MDLSGSHPYHKLLLLFMIVTSHAPAINGAIPESSDGAWREQVRLRDQVRPQVAAAHGAIPKAVGSVYSCYARPADVIFVLDSSNSIWRPDFETQLKFVNDVIDFFPLGDDFIQVGVITYSSLPFVSFGLGEYDDREDIRRAVQRIRQEGGIYTHTDKALELMRSGFRKSPGSRPGVIKVGIVITDGRSSNPYLTRLQATYARSVGINLFAIGVGDSYDELELTQIANQPSEDFTFLVSSYTSLDKIKEMLAIKTCTVTDPPTTTTTTTTPTTTTPTTTTTTTSEALPTVRIETAPVMRTFTPSRSAYLEREDSTILFGPNGCKVRQPLHLAFVVDDKLGGRGNKQRLYQLIRGVISKLDFHDDDVKVSYIRECAEVPEIRLSRYRNKSDVLQQLERMRPVLERTPGLLRAATNTLTGDTDTFTVRDIFTENDVIAENHRERIAVYITNGESRDLEATLREAQFAKHNNISIIGVGVGDDVNMVELKALVSCEPENFLHTASTSQQLRHLHENIARNICEVSLP